MDYKKLGEYGENIACDYLKRKGYKILERNYIKELSALSKGEIDIIAKKDNIISFVEVKTQEYRQKTSAVSGGFLPEDRVNFQKQQKLKRLSQMWLTENKIPFESCWQIDVVSVNIDTQNKKAKIRHFQNAIF
jgi:putative endonuclease